jgi:energy-coupling factor transporter ATP-binding protein EcfA2
MLTHVEIENYRGFQSYRLENATAVNLLVGKNNSGKTALLECIHFLASGGDPMVLVDSASRRREVVVGGREEPDLLDISHFFCGHEIEYGTSFSVSGGSEMPAVSANVVSLADIDPEPRLFDQTREDRAAYVLKIEGGLSESFGRRYFVLSEDGEWLFDPRRAPRRWFSEGRRNGPSIVFVAPDSLEPESLGNMWNQVLRERQEGEIREAMRILEPTLEDIVFQTAEISYPRYARSSIGRAAVLASFENDPRRVPLGSMGDGMHRVLSLALSLAHAKGACLLIDEIDTGLHYSVMTKMWELVVRTAQRAGTQVFATTHSADCVRGLGVLGQEHPELQSLVSAHKIERDLDHDIGFSGAEVLNAVKQDIEIR